MIWRIESSSYKHLLRFCSSIQMAAHNSPYSSFGGYDAISWFLQVLHTPGTYTYVQAKHLYKIKSCKKRWGDEIGNPLELKVQEVMSCLVWVLTQAVCTLNH